MEDSLEPISHWNHTGNATIVGSVSMLEDSLEPISHWNRLEEKVQPLHFFLVGRQFGADQPLEPLDIIENHDFHDFEVGRQFGADQPLEQCRGGDRGCRHVLM